MALRSLPRLACVTPFQGCLDGLVQVHNMAMLDDFEPLGELQVPRERGLGDELEVPRERACVWLHALWSVMRPPVQE